MIFVRKINQHQILRPKIDTEHIFQQISHLDPLMGIRFCPKSRVDSFWIVLANHKRRLFSFMGYVKRVCLLRLFFCNDICDPPQADTKVDTPRRYFYWENCSVYINCLRSRMRERSQS